MNFHEILRGPLGQGLAWTLLHFLWQGLLIGAVAAAAGWLFSPSRTRGHYAVAMTGLVLMACCPLVTFAVLQIPAPKNVAVAPSPDLRNGKMQPSAAVPFLEDDVALPAPRPSHLVSMAPPSAHRIVSDAPATAAPVPPPIEPEWRERIARRAAALQSYMVTAWLAGVIALSGRLLMSLLGVRRLARGRLPVSAEIASCANRLARRLGLSASPGVFVSRRIREAMLVGLWRPMVLLPAAWIAEMPPDVLEAVIAHELAHMRRLDLWANLVQRLVETLLFYHPAVWWLSRRASLLREMCADELAVEATGERMTYATVLELLGRQRLKLPAPQLATGIGGRRMVLLARVRNILGAAPGDERLRWWPAGLLALLVPLGIWLGSIGLCGDLTAKNSGAAEKPKTDGPAAKSSGTAANAHGRGETGEKPKASSKPIVSTVTTKPGEPWPLSLKETLRVALLNSKAMRQIRAIVQLPDSKNNSAPSADRRPALTPDNNRLVVARGNTDIGLIEFEASVCNLVSDVETAYWDLFLKYRLLETAVQGRDRALRAWQKANEIYLNGPKEGGAAFEAQALEQYYGFRNAAEQAQAQLYDAERRLRFLMGIAATDGRSIRPKDDPTTAKVSFDWQKVLSEAIQRSPAIRKARFRVKQRELELNAAEKYVVPADQKDESLAIQSRKDSIANVNLALARERVKLAETEKEVASQLSFAVSGMDAAYIGSVTNFNRRAAAKRQLAAVEAACGNGLGGVTFNDLLNAQQRPATAEGDYYSSLTIYAKAISQVHLLKGTLLDYHGIELAERPDQHVTADPAKQGTNNPAGNAVVSPSDSRDAAAKTTAVEGSVPTIDQISAAWMARQKRVRSAKVQWKETEFIAKGTMPPLRPELFDQDEASRPTKIERQPPTDVSLDCTQTVLINDDMLRIDREGAYWHPHRGLQQDFKVDTFDVEVSKTFYDERSDHELIGFIQKEARNHEYDCYLYWPIALAFRPCDPDMGGLKLKLCRINPSLETVDGRPCVVLLAPNMTLWLDPRRDFNVVKFGHEARDWSCDISYQEDQSHIWVPVAWKTVFIWNRDSKPRQRTVAKVTDYKVNTDIPRSAFQFDFPVDTYVSDLKSQNREDYIVRPGGKKRLITKEEISRGAAVNYQELLHTESGMARGKLASPKANNPSSAIPASKAESQIIFGGVCRDERGVLVSGAHVSLFLYDSYAWPDQRLQSVIADDGGRFRFAAISGLSRSDEDSKYFWIGTTAKGRASVVFRLTAKQWRDHDHLEIVMPEAASLRGRVSEPDGRPVEGARVWTPSGEPVEGVHTAITDSEGRFEISDLAKRDGNPTPVPGHPGMFTQTYPALRVRHPGHALALTSFSQVPGTVDVTLQAAAVIEGRLVYADSNKPAAGVPLLAQTIQEEGVSHPGGEVATDSTGHYRFDSLAAGKYQIILLTCKGDYTMSALESIEASAGATKTAPELRLVHGGLIVGRVIDADSGRPVRPMSAGPSPTPLYVRMYGPSRPLYQGACETTQIQADGSFQLRAAPGANLVNLQHVGHSLPGVNIFVLDDDGWEDVSNNALTVNVAEGQAVKIEFKVRKKAATIRGTATDKAESLPATESANAAGSASTESSGSSVKTSAANAADNAPPDEAWSETLNGVRVRLLAPKGATYRHGAVLPLIVELQNNSDKPIACNTLWHTVRIVARDSDDNKWHGAPGMGPELAGWVGQADLAPGKTAELTLSFQSLRFGRPLKAGETIQLQASAPTQQPRPGQLPLEVLSPPVIIRVQDAFPPDVGAADFSDKWQMNLACELNMGLRGNRRLQVDEHGAAKLLNAYQVNGQRINNCLKVTLPPERMKKLAAELRQMQAWKLAQVRRDMPPNPDEGYIRLSLVCPSGASVVGQYAGHAESSQPIVSELRKLMEGLMGDLEKAAKTSAARSTTDPKAPEFADLISRPESPDAT